MSFMQKALKNKKFDDTTTFTADALRPPQFYVDTGSLTLNAAISGSFDKGLPSNSIIALAGEPATGKTFFALSSVAGFLRDNPTGEVVYFESEKAIKAGMLKSRGIDESRVYISEVVSVQDFRTRAIQLLDEYKLTPKEERNPLMFVLDSLGNLSTTKELEDTAEGKETKDMTRPAIIKAAFRVLTLKCGQLDVPVIITNHTYDEMGSMYPTKQMSGGSGLKYCASSIIFLSKRKEKDGNEVVGNVITARMFKSRDTKEHLKVETMLDYSSGLDKYYGLLELGEAAGVFKKVSTRYEVVDQSTGEIKKVFGKNIIENPEEYYTPEVLEKIQEYVTKTFMYSSVGHTKTNDVEDTEEGEQPEE